MTVTFESPAHAKLYEALVSSRKFAGISQVELAERLGCHQSMIARIETGSRRIDAVELIAIARALNVDAAEFLKKIEGLIPPDYRIASKSAKG